MCRWLAYSGAPIYLERLIFQTQHSLIDQSRRAENSPETTNGDGFGIGWYGSREEPGIYKDIQPAWNDGNLRDLTAQITSPLFLAHVRSATGTAVQRSNCHPFRYGRWLFQHNGLISGFHQLKRELMMAIDPLLFPYLSGTTDSEVMFYLGLSLGLAEEPFDGLARMAGLVEHIAAQRDIERPLQMTLGLSDGKHVYAVRYSSERHSRTLFHTRSASALHHLSSGDESFPHNARAVVSEPLTRMTEEWVPVPESTALIVEAGEIECRPFEPIAP